MADTEASAYATLQLVEASGSLQDFQWRGGDLRDTLGLNVILVSIRLESKLAGFSVLHRCFSYTAYRSFWQSPTTTRRMRLVEPSG